MLTRMQRDLPWRWTQGDIMIQRKISPECYVGIFVSRSWAWEPQAKNNLLSFGWISVVIYAKVIQGICVIGLYFWVGGVQSFHCLMVVQLFSYMHIYPGHLVNIDIHRLYILAKESEFTIHWLWFLFSQLDSSCPFQTGKPVWFQSRNLATQTLINQGLRVGL